MNKKRILLTIAYDGIDYSGWQKQKNSTVKTIEEEVEQMQEYMLWDKER